jgi:hypothetical protein
MPSPSLNTVSDDPEDTCTNAIGHRVRIRQNCNTARGLEDGVLAVAATVLAVATVVYSIGLHLHAVAHPNRQREAMQGWNKIECFILLGGPE